jgi:RimJ/RimL family protein N-acetyltransferase
MKISSKLSLRKINFSDIEFLWYLRNRPDVYKYSRINRAVSWKKHIDWILPILLEISNKELLIIKNLQIPIGQVRFDYRNPKEAEISISILKRFRGKGFAMKALNLAIRKIKKQNKAKLLIAVTHKKNIPSQKLFKKLNFILKEKKGIWLKYILEL